MRLYKTNVLGTIGAATSILILLLTIGAPSQRMSGSALRGTPSPIVSSICKVNIGDNITGVAFTTPTSTKTFGGVALRYSSSFGWELFTSLIIKTSNGIFYDEGNCVEPLTRKGDGTYATRYGFGIFALSPDQTEFTIYSKADGSTERYIAGTAAPDGTVTYRLDKVSNRNGWQTRYVRNADFTLAEVKIDEREGVPPQFLIKLNPLSGLLNSVEVLGKTGQVIYSYSLLWEGSKLKRVAHINSTSGEVGAREFDYDSNGLLSKDKTSPLGGETEFSYQGITVTPPPGQSGIPLNRFNISQVTSSAKAGAASETIQVNFQVPIFTNGKFEGFALVRATDSVGRTVEENFGTGDLGGLVSTAIVKDSSGAPVTVANWEHVVVNSQVQLQSTSSENYSASGNTRYRTSYIYDPEGRLQGALNEGQVGDGGSFTADDSVISVEYANLPNEPLRWTPKKMVIHYGNGSSFRETNFQYDNNGHIKGVSRRSESGFEGEAGFTYDNFGNGLTAVNEKKTTSVAEYSSDGYRLDKTSLLSHDSNTLEEFTYEYHPFAGTVEAVTNIAGTTASIERNADGRLKNVTVSNGRTSRRLMEVAYSLAGSTDSSSNNVVSSTYLSGLKAGSSLDGFGESTKSWIRKLDNTYQASAITTQNGGEVLKAYPNFASVTEQFNAAELNGKFHFTTFLDAAGRMASIQPSSSGVGLYEVNFTYGDVPSPVGFPNPESISIHVAGQATVAINNWINTSTSLVYDGQETIIFQVINEGNKGIFKDGAGNTFTSQADGKGRVTSAQIPGSTDFRIVYNDDALSSTVTDSAGRTVTTFPGDNGQVSKITYGPIDDPTSEEHRYDYNTLNRLMRISGPNDTVEFGYSVFGELTRIIHRDLDTNETYNCGFRYNAKGQLDEISYPNNQAGGSVIVNYAYDALGNPFRIYSPNIPATDNTVVRYNEWDKFSAPKVMSYPQLDLREEVTRSAELGFTLSRSIKQESSGNELANTNYNWNHLGQLLSETTNNSAGQSSRTYLYDTFGRVSTSVTNNNGASAQKTFRYDNIARVDTVTDSTVGEYAFDYATDDPYQTANFSVANVQYANVYRDQELQEVYLDTVKKLSINYTPGGEASSIATTNNGQFFGAAQLVRSVLGGFLKITFRDNAQNVVKTEQNYCNGIYKVITDATGIHGVANIPGPKSDGSGVYVYSLTYSQLAGTQGLQGGTTGDPASPAPGVRPPQTTSTCGDDVISGSEQCEGASGCDGGQACLLCRCQPARPPNSQGPYINGYGMGTSGPVPVTSNDSSGSGTSTGAGNGVTYGSNGFSTKGPCDELTAEDRIAREIQRAGYTDQYGNWIGPVMTTPSGFWGSIGTWLSHPINSGVTWWTAGDRSELPDDGNRVTQGMTILTGVVPVDGAAIAVSLGAAKLAATAVGKRFLGWAGALVGRAADSVATGGERACTKIAEAINPAKKSGSGTTESKMELLKQTLGNDTPFTLFASETGQVARTSACEVSEQAAILASKEKALQNFRYLKVESLIQSINNGGGRDATRKARSLIYDMAEAQIDDSTIKAVARNLADAIRNRYSGSVADSRDLFYWKALNEAEAIARDGGGNCRKLTEFYDRAWR